MIYFLFFTVIAVLFLPTPTFPQQDDLLLLYPLGSYPEEMPPSIAPSSPLDTWYELNHTDNYPEYYLGSGSIDDTFFVVFQTPLPCSVHCAEIQWWDGGGISSFAALYSYDAQELYPLGQAPNRGTCPVSPIGEWLTDLYNGSVWGSGEWEPLNFGEESIIIGEEGMTNILFGIGFIKGFSAPSPHPLADRMSSKNIRYTYTWFGGPWMSSWPYLWGGYSYNLVTGTVIEAMVRVWISFVYDYPIWISNLTSHSNTFSTTGPFTITCKLEDENSVINEEDQIYLKYYIDSISNTISVPLTDVLPLGDSYYGADIEGSFAIGDTIHYWIYAEDEDHNITTYPGAPWKFRIVASQNPDAEILLIDDDYDPEDYKQVLQESGLQVEEWQCSSNNGIDEYVLNYGWDAVFLIAHNSQTMKRDSNQECYREFLDNGGKLLYIDEAFMNDIYEIDTLNFTMGDFENDYLGISTLFCNPENPDTVYYGVYGSPVGFSFQSDPLVTFPNSYNYYFPDNFYISTGYPALYGQFSELSYCLTNENGFKVVYCSFNLDLVNDNPPMYEISPQFRTFIYNTLDWFEIPYTGVETPSNILHPSSFFLSCSPNPFNQQLTSSFELRAASPYKLVIYDISGRVVSDFGFRISNLWMNRVVWDASGQASGVYFVRLMVDGRWTMVRKVVLMK